MQNADSGNFLKDYGTLIIAVYGVVQLWLVAFYKRFLRKAKVEVFETGSVEVGFINMGPMIGLSGTLFAVHREILVERIGLEITRVKDNMTHLFTWGALRPTKLFLQPQDVPSLDLPASFLLSPDQPWKYNISFLDSDTQDVVGSIVSECWEIARELHAEVTAKPDWQGSLSDADRKEFEAKYNQNKTCLEAFNKLNRLMYWEQGHYKATIRVYTRNPKKQFTKSWQFVLSETDYNQLRLNISAIHSSPRDSYLNVQQGNPFFVNAKYQADNASQ